jgi:catechol-2,3-dioxygenase
VNHIALRVDSVGAVEAAKRRLEAAGVSVLGVTDHHFIKSIYFFDPNGIRLELTAYTGPDAYVASKERSAHEECAAWTREKAERRRAGTLGAVKA